MPCNPPYRTPISNLGVQPGTLGLVPCICPYSTCNSYVYSDYYFNSYNTFTNCCTPCTLFTEPSYNPANNQCFSRIALGGTGNYNPPLENDDFPFNPLISGVPFYFCRFYQASIYSVEINFEECCCSLGGVVANSGTVKIKMGEWTRKDLWWYGYFAPPASLTEVGFLSSYLTDPSVGPWPEGCGKPTIPYCGWNCRSSDPDENCLLDGAGRQAFVFTVIKTETNCNQKFYYGHNEIPVNGGDLLTFHYNILPTSIPSFTAYSFGIGAEYTYPAQTLPFTTDCSFDVDCAIWMYMGSQGGCTSGYFYGYGGLASRGDIFQAKKACSGGNPTPPAFRRRMLEKQVLSRIKKVHYKP